MEVLSRGFRINYVVEGAGEPVVLIPGFCDRAANWQEFGYVSALNTHHRVVAIDPLGHGYSDRPHEAESYTMRDIIADTIAVLDQENLDSTIVWGYSRGAAIAAGLATLHPDRITRLILGGYYYGLAPAANRREILEARVATLRKDDWDGFITAMGFPELSDPSIADAFRADNDAQALAAVVEGGLLGEPIRVSLSHLSGRTLLYLGSEELPLKAGADEIRQRCIEDGVQLETIQGVGHVGAYLRSEAVLPLVRSFLAAPAVT